MRYLGVIIPPLVLLVGLFLVALGAGAFSRRRVGLRLTAVFVGVAILIVMAVGLVTHIADRVGYVLPWHATPSEVVLHGREYVHQGCDTPTKRPHSLIRVGWALGYFSLSRPLLARAIYDHGLQPSVLWMGGGSSNCEPVYALSGGN
jgi:hypothetical protein